MSDILDKKFDHKLVEKKKYDFWLENNLFANDENSKKEPFSILLPPPNVTGKLHIGHALDSVIPDLLIRFKKINGYDTNWIPGMDHAGIATQAKVEQLLWDQEKITKYDLGREEFIKRVWDWKDNYANNIREQWAKLGLSLNYKQEYFTYSKELNEIVNHIFVKMYNEGLIYKANRIILWDCKFKTALSNIEVVYEEKKGSMYYFKYFVEGSTTDFLTVATTRPETIFADSAIIVNPEDDRYKNYVGKNLINPLNNKLLPIIADDYVEKDFGTGVMKCSPGHDVNDFELGKKYNLETINVFNEDGSLSANENVLPEFIDEDRFKARKHVIEFTIENGTFIKKEDITHNIGLSERSSTIVEPMVKDQWFVKMEKLAKLVIDMQDSKNNIDIFPKRLDSTLKHWMENIHDWTISRQIWWGHQIPVWYHNVTGEVYVNETPPSDKENWTQDSDVLDTWFSSGLLPFSSFKDWDLKKEVNNNKGYNKYFPTSVLVTGYDLLFFWIARMSFFNKYFTNKKPFDKVLFHGLVRDEQGRKMSKSLGNGVDPMDVIEEFGADALRFALITNSSPGQDIRFSEEKLRFAWNFINKIWNASRYILMNIDDSHKYNDSFWKNKNYHPENDVDKWVLSQLSIAEKNIKKNIDNFEFAVAGKTLLDFVWDTFCSWYIELSKVNLASNNEEVKSYTLNTMIYVLKNILIISHGFLPFVTEEIYWKLKLKKSVLLENWIEETHSFKITYMEPMIKIVTAIRNFRAENNINKSIALEFKLNLNNSNNKDIIIKSIDSINEYMLKLANSTILLEKNIQSQTSIIPIDDYSLEIENSTFINKEQLLIDLNKKLEAVKREIARSEGLMSNQSFLTKASKEKVEQEKLDYEDYKKQMDILLTKINEIV